MRVIKLGRIATMFAAVLLASSTMVSCGPKDEPKPAAAGEIQGPTEVEEGSSIELSIATIKNADTYKWYKDGTMMQNTASRTLTVTAAGTYKVAGVNDQGEGAASANHVVTLATVGGDEAPAAAGTISGPTEVEEGSSIELSIATITGAETYKWYKDGVEVQNSASRILTVNAAGVYKVAGVNSVGEGTASADHTVTLINLDTPPAAAGTISGPSEVAEGGSIELSIGEIARAETYKWYKDGVEVQNDASRTLTVTEVGTYKVAGVNAYGEGTASADHVVTLLDESTLQFTDIPAGTVAAAGIPSLLETPGPSSWSATIAHASSYYVINNWGGKTVNVYVDYNADATLTIDNYSVIGRGTHPTYGELEGYFDAIYIVGEYFYILDDYQISFDKTTNTLDFSGKCTHPDDGQEYDVMCGVPAYTAAGQAVAFFTEAYIDAKLVITPNSAAPVKMSGNKVPMRYNFATGLYEFENIKFGGVVKNGKIVRK